jgi:hypothetical protein
MMGTLSEPLALGELRTVGGTSDDPEFDIALGKMFADVDSV